MFMLHRQVTSFPAMTSERGKMEFESSDTPLGTTFTSHLIAAAFPKARQLVGGSEKVTTCLPPGGGQRVTVLRRMTGEKKNKNSIFQNCWACCYGDEPSPPSSVLLNLFSYLLLLSHGRRFFSFSYFSVLFPCNGGLS